MNCSATLHEMCVMYTVSVVNEQMVYCLNILFFFLSTVTILCGYVKCH